MRRLLALALLCFVSTLSAQSPQNEESAVEQGRNREGPEGQGAPDPALIARLIESVETTVDYLSRNEATNNYPSEYDRATLSLQRRDLETQRDIARYTFGMALLALVSVCIGGAGLYMLGRTLVYTKEAAINTREANTILETSSQKQIRAYISVLVAKDVGKRFTGDMTWTFEVAYRNDGHTPARAVTLYCSDFVSERSLNDGELPEITPENSTRLYFGTLAPGADKTEKYRGVSKIKEERVYVYIFGKVVYEDVFEQEQTTPFCAEIMAWNAGAKPVRTRFGNDAT